MSEKDRCGLNTRELSLLMGCPGMQKPAPEFTASLGLRPKLRPRTCEPVPYREEYLSIPPGTVSKLGRPGLAPLEKQRTRKKSKSTRFESGNP